MLTRIENSYSIPDDASGAMSVNLNDNTAKLSSAIQNLPQLLEKKRRIKDAYHNLNMLTTI
jgi:hypothetical protein